MLFSPIERLERRTLFAGGLDPSFGAGGVASLNIPGYQVQVADSKLQQDGKILVVGTGTISGSVSDPSGVSDMVVARFNGDGSLDTSFSNDGWTAIDIDQRDIAAEIEVLAHSIYVVGTADAPSVATRTVIGVLAESNGAPRETSPTIELPVAAVTRMAVQNAGGLVLVQQSVTDPSDLTVRRLTINGDVDTEFGTNGATSLAEFPLRSLFGVITDSRDRIVISAGEPGDDMPRRVQLVRLSSDGSIDRRFGNNGLVRSTFGSSAGMAAKSDGSIVVATQYSLQDFSSGLSAIEHQFVSLYDSRGRKISSFRTSRNGLERDGVAGGILGVGAQSDGKILVADRLGIVRYRRDGRIDNSYTTTGYPGEGWIIGEVLVKSDGAAAAVQSDFSNTFRIIQFESGFSPYFSVDDEGTLNVKGTSNGDYIILTAEEDGEEMEITIVVNQASAVFSTEQIQRIEIRARGGVDNIEHAYTGVQTWIYGGAGADFIEFSNAPMDPSDPPDFPPCVSMVFGESGDDTIRGSNGDDQIFAGSGDDTIYGLSGNDYVEGQSGNDVFRMQRIGATDPVSFFDGGRGQDTIYSPDVFALSTIHRQPGFDILTYASEFYPQARLVSVELLGQWG